MSYARIASAADDAGLMVMGAVHPVSAPDGRGVDGTLILLGAGAAFWPVFSASPEATDGATDPVDRWSERVVNGLAGQFGVTAIYPFGGPPYAPFIDWALKSGRAFSSPTGMLVHDQVGLMISYRGALLFDRELTFPASTGSSPCDSCLDQPCITACPVGALSGSAAYDVPACHSYLDTTPGQSCMDAGCAVRRACPVSRGAQRPAAQSALHMKAFHRT